MAIDRRRAHWRPCEEPPRGGHSRIGTARPTRSRFRVRRSHVASPPLARPARIFWQKRRALLVGKPPRSRVVSTPPARLECSRSRHLEPAPSPSDRRGATRPRGVSRFLSRRARDPRRPRRVSRFPSPFPRFSFSSPPERRPRASPATPMAPPTPSDSAGGSNAATAEEALPPQPPAPAAHHAAPAPNLPAQPPTPPHSEGADHTRTHTRRLCMLCCAPPSSCRGFRETPRSCW